MTVWTEKLAPAQVKYMNDLVAQVPETMGARQAFIDILQALADAPADFDKPFRFMIISQGNVMGTKAENIARQYAESEYDYVIDTVTNTWLVSADPSDDTDIPEAI